MSDPSSGGTYFSDVGLLSGTGRGGTPYTLTNPGYTPGIFRDLPSRFPIPDILAAINLRPVLSLGLNGTGERDIAHHYHPVTVMRLLQGRKIWALRPPGDQECMRNTGSCTDPLNVCEFYATPDAPAPACIQEAGDTIIVPDGWYHGTCNNASVTVGWGAQGRSLPLQPPSCFHCSLRGGSRGQLQYATTTAELPQLSLSEHRALNDVLAGGAARHLPPSQDGIGSNFLYLGPVHQSIYMGFRSLLHQFVVQTDLEAEQNADLRAPDCRLLTGAAAALRDGRAATTVSWLRSAVHVAFYVNVRGKPISLRWRHQARANWRSASWSRGTVRSGSATRSTRSCMKARVACLRAALRQPSCAGRSCRGSLAPVSTFDEIERCLQLLDVHALPRTCRPSASPCCWHRSPACSRRSSDRPSQSKALLRAMRTPSLRSITNTRPPR